MKKLAITLTAIATLVMSGSTASANDLIKALATIQRINNGPAYGPNHRAYSNRGSVYGRPPVRVVTTAPPRRDLDYGRSARSRSLEVARLRSVERAKELARLERLAELKRLERLDRERSRSRSRVRTTTRVNFNIGYQDNVPALPAPIPELPRYSIPPVPQAPVYVPPAPVLPAPPVHAPAFGEVISCEVPLFKRVRVRDRHNIARGARPMVIAIKSPSACGHACNCCADEVSYVQVMAPPREPRHIEVSPCGRKVRMDFGKHEIDIVAYNDYIKVDYDN